MSLLPKAAEEYGRQIALGLDGDARAALKARVILRKLLGDIRLLPEGKELWAEYDVRPRALLKAPSDQIVAGGGFVRFRTASLRAAA